MKRNHVILASILGLAVMALVIFLAGNKSKSSKLQAATPQPNGNLAGLASTNYPAAPTQTPHLLAVPGEIAIKAIAPAPLPNLTERSPLADHLNDPQQTIGQDLAIVLDLLEHYRGMYGALPTAEDNRQVVNALAGNNPRRLAFIERSNPALNAQGELTDRWKTPFFFHFISQDALEIRSAGPDREFYTDDDLIKGSASLNH